ncbi:MAG: hypothetical protein Q9227_002302 [Pyrenula ochraceoflavens]
MRPVGRYLVGRSLVAAIVKILSLLVAQAPLSQAIPLHFDTWTLVDENEPDPKAPDDPSLWIYLAVAAALVLLGGAFAGLTIALMGQDEIYLQVIKTSGEGSERKHAAKVLRLLNRGKHWVLVTLLLSNVITNETLPIVLDRSLGGGWPAVLGSTVLIVIFGEIAPQSVCVRYGLPIGAWMSPFVLALMYVLAPVAWPTAKLLDYLLGEEHGTIYKKAGLKTLVSLHKSLGETGQQLNADEVTIISSVLDLKDKAIGTIMTPMQDVFCLSLDDVLDESTMDVILSHGFSRIPIHHPDNEENFVGMLLVKMLITYDPEDAKPVRDFALATLPETSPETSCLDIVNFFQEGKSHMILVSSDAGTDHGALGVVTLEDVIEELIGEEIIDESDVYVDVHKAVRRLAPAPRMRLPRQKVISSVKDETSEGQDATLIDIAEGEALSPEELHRSRTADTGPVKKVIADHSSSPSNSTTNVRRRSSAGGSLHDAAGPLPRRANPELYEHLKHLGPSNLASRPKATRYMSVKIKPGTSAETGFQTSNAARAQAPKVSRSVSDYGGGIGEGLVASGGIPAKDGVQALQTGYGTMEHSKSPTDRRPSSSADKAIQTPQISKTVDGVDEDRSRKATKDDDHSSRSQSRSTIRSLRARSAESRTYQPRGPARSGSITENVVDINGIRKVVLEATSSSSSNDEEENNGPNMTPQHEPDGATQEDSQDGQAASGLRSQGTDTVEMNGNGNKKGKKKRRRRKGHGNGSGGGGEREPLLQDQ